MTPPVKLPWELEEDILSRLPLQSLVRFRTVCKQWNSVFNGKSFLTNHMSRTHPQFIFLTESKIYSIDIINHNKSINPTIELHELVELPSFDIHYGDPSYIYTTITSCDEILLYNYPCGKKKAALWNPWLRQVKWIERKDEQFHHVVGLGYDNSRPEKVYKMLVWFLGHPNVQRVHHHQKVAIYECASHELKFIDTPAEEWPITQTVKRAHVSFNGNLYWVTCNLETPHEYFIRSFDFSTDNFKPFCLLPCQKNHTADEFILAVYKGDRFSLLKQCYVTKKIEIWVTKNNIDRDEVVWINLMTLQTTNLPRLFYKFDSISYFIYDKTIFMCCGDDETGVACIYIVREDLCKKIPIGFGIVKFCHCVYTPNLISVPLVNCKSNFISFFRSFYFLFIRNLNRLRKV